MTDQRLITDAEAIWHSKTDDEVFAAAASLDDYTEEGRRIIVLEADRRGLNVVPIIAAVGDIRGAPKETGLLPHCEYCGTRIFFGGEREGDSRFCNAECKHRGILLVVTRGVPDSAVTEQLWQLQQGRCPRCGGPGPVDVRSSYRVWSAVLFTSWSNRPHISCHKCGVAANVKDSVFSLLFGWWGLPWGPVMTVVQVSRNLSGLFYHGDDSRPSAQLEKLVRLRLAAEILDGAASHGVAPDARKGDSARR